MIDGADAGRKPQPFRRMHGYRRIENGRARHHQVMAQHFLDLGARVGDPGDGAELASGDGRGNADLASPRSIHVRRHTLHRSNPVDVVDGADIVGEAKLDGFGAVGDRAAPYCDDDVCIGSAGLFSGGDNRLTRSVGRHRIEASGVTWAETFADFVDLVGISIERAADHQESAA